MNKEVIIEMLDNKLLTMEELKQVQASIFNGEVKTIMLFIENQQQELERLQQENKQLKEDFAVLKKLQMISNDILNELEEWLKKEKQIAEQNIIESKKWLEIEEAKENAKSDIHTGKIIRRYMQYGLNKIQELRNKYEK